MLMGTSTANDPSVALIAIWLVQTALTTLACYGLWRFWRSLRDYSRAFTLVVTAGLLVRAAVGQALFWISYLHLPIGRSLQIGRGLWFFALDAWNYFDYAAAFSNHGLVAIESPNIPSHFFIGLAGSVIALFGPVTSVALLINCSAYLGTCALIGYLGGRNPAAPLPSLVAVGFLAFSPSSILWSLQLLKDGVTVFLVVAFVAVCARWEDSVDSGTAPATGRTAGLIALLGVLVCAVAGIRWYVAAVLWGAVPLFTVTLIATSRRKVFATISGIAAFALLGPALAAGAGKSMPFAFSQLVSRPQNSIQSVQTIREAYDEIRGGTEIVAGPLLASGGRTRAPSPPARRLIAGAAAAFLPRAVGESLGLVRMGGGRGMWLFAELDTLLLDALLVWAAYYCIRAMRRSRSLPPTFVLVAVSLVCLTLPMLYGVSNFGTLFRFRYAIAIEIAMLPIVARRRVGKEPASAPLR